MRLLRLPTHRHFHRYLLAVAYLLLILPISHAYSVLSHEQVIDLVWKDNLQPMILHRFPAATADDLKRAHAFAYGGSFLLGVGSSPSCRPDILAPPPPCPRRSHIRLTP